MKAHCHQPNKWDLCRKGWHLKGFWQLFWQRFVPSRQILHADSQNYSFDGLAIKIDTFKCLILSALIRFAFVRRSYITFNVVQQSWTFKWLTSENITQCQAIDSTQLSPTMKGKNHPWKKHPPIPEFYLNFCLQRKWAATTLSQAIHLNIFKTCVSQVRHVTRPGNTWRKG